MTNIASLSGAEIERLVQDMGAPVAAPLVMPKQVLESAEPLSLRRAGRAILTMLNLGSAPRQEM